ncbi:short chain dehydrogenase [Croceicoccus estronivorus]|uniref:SDR family oxidoreductase n=1 Tax=Croceicoccus estronivorus TaxID=1172626 RepID=UPI00082A2E2D|nr:SDR family oxidoreductase [Croceicoccus estronivorus]OCC25162.1 short chain dehydrogenase [Croceicoccus estronivorus]
MINYGMDGKVALVTGGGGGIGRATALAFAHSGAAVLVSDVHDGNGTETVALIEAQGGKAAFQHCDVSDGDQVKAMVAAALKTFGRLDYAFNNAGINRPGADEYEDENWDLSIGINLTGVMLCMREEAEVMLQNGGGAIVNTASINGLVGNGGQPAYTASKHGVVGLTRHGALRWAKNGIRVNAVCPGVIDTPMSAEAAADPAVRQIIEGMTPMGRMGEASEIAAAVVWLCSNEASFVTGLPLVVDGGATVF